MKKEELHYLEPTISEKHLWNANNLFFAFAIGILVIISFVLLLFFLKLSFTNSIISASILIIFYAIVLFFLLEPRILREIKQPIIKTLNNEVVVEKPIYKQIPYEVEKTIYVTNPIKEEKPKLNSKQRIKFKFISSIKSGTYHESSCRLSRLIKQKYKIGKNSIDYFKNHNYKPCKICIKNKYP